MREVLERIFGLSPAAATACIGAAEANGRVVIRRFAAAEAQPRIVTARRLARAEKFPLWIGIDADDASPRWPAARVAEAEAPFPQGFQPDAFPGSKRA